MPNFPLYNVIRKTSIAGSGCVCTKILNFCQHCYFFVGKYPTSRWGEGIVKLVSILETYWKSGSVKSVLKAVRTCGFLFNQSLNCGKLNLKEQTHPLYIPSLPSDKCLRSLKVGSLFDQQLRLSFLLAPLSHLDCGMQNRLQQLVEDLCYPLYLTYLLCSEFTSPEFQLMRFSNILF